ncbi:ArsR/SmtB family transcription factor [Ornithinimicrobium cryptoxanthini]|uniref:ArsR/SmtB family transcription factor n=1 Tax=Ornithinimicrobium cryptoxanthini TaxID=2934161 RepID=UPI0021191001|nr:winged helix-turn-helix domain-containing protein [Ornithinimicrobium cryptoxanthini]
MTDDTTLPDRDASDGPEPGAAVPDYELLDALTLEDPAQYRALFEETRQAIVALLRERAATISELAAALDKPKGTLGHHMQVLADAGLVHVVRTKKVRALEAKYWGRTARIFFYEHLDTGHGQRVLARAAAEVGQAEAEAEAAGLDVARVLDVNRRDVRIRAERAREFRHRLGELLTDFADEPRSGDQTYALVYGIFPSATPSLPTAEDEA